PPATSSRSSSASRSRSPGPRRRPPRCAPACPPRSPSTSTSSPSVEPHFAGRVVALELRRSDIGFGRVVVDDTGVTRHFARSIASIAWDEIRDYRLKVEIRGARLEVLYLVRWIDMLL